uniref:SMP-LTD domain-containing protein n=1 Tax=Electrophorus electricus TaxID=8005 RepID=A0A4W4EG62_ELEEL
MTSRQGGHGNQSPLSSALLPASSAPKLHVQRSQSRETITIHFSALGKDDEDEEEELYWPSTPNPSSSEATNNRVITALEASEDLVIEGDAEVKSAENVAAPLDMSSVMSTMSGQQNTTSQEHSLLSSASAFARAEKSPASSSGSTNSSPSKSTSLPSMDKAFLNLRKSLSTEVEPREGVPVHPTLRHRQLVKNLYKSLSTDTAPDAAGSNRPLDSRLNLQLFKPFSQPRASTSDCKTAPSSPLSSPDNRSFSFKVSEVEARIEDTKRRFSEVMSEPLQLISKFIGDEASSIYRPKPVSSSTSELTSLSALGDHLENNNNYSIKEEEGDAEGEGVTPGATEQALFAESKPVKPSPSSVGLDKCSMSALAKQEDEEFCELYSDDFEACADDEAVSQQTEDTKARDHTGFPASRGMDHFIDGEMDLEPAPRTPNKTLLALTVIIYGYFVLPLPIYVSGMLLGVALGFMVAIGVVWLTGPAQPGVANRHRRHRRWNMLHLDVKEPDIFKGWMNEIQNYDPETYHATLTHSVFVRLEGSALRISRPNKNITRRASYSEPKPDVAFVSQKIYDLTDSKVCLVPPGLARKRVFNKKYPICIELAKQNDFMSKADGDRACSEKDDPDCVGKEREPPIIFLFGRTGREKEEWFRRILLASKLKSEAAKKSVSLSSSRTPLLSHSRSSSRSSLDELLSSQASKRESCGNTRQKPLLEYSTYMANYIRSATRDNLVSSSGEAGESPHDTTALDKKLPGSPVKEEGLVSWVNALIGRILWDFLRERHWADWVSKKIQMKLSKIRLPYFMNELTLTELDMGMCTPRILWASQPSVDHQGVWFDLEISYKGSFLMTLETKMNLSRLGKETEGLGEFGKEGHRPRTYCLADSDEESSSAGSSDEDDGTENVLDKNLLQGAEGYTGVHKPSKIMRFVDKLTKNKYFQKATETEFIKKKMEEVSNTPLLLTVELQECQGTLAVNIPPPPTDRIWYGFRSPPKLELKARPKLGEREVTFAHVTDWIEKKLEQEFQKILVMPNMDDIWLHVMHSATDPRSDTVQTDSRGPASAPDADVPTSEVP